MPFTSRAALKSASAPGPAASGSAVLFRIEEVDWVVAWYEEETAINLPSVREWLQNARPGHRWFAAFRPSAGATLPPVSAGAALELEIGGTPHPVDWLDEIHGVLGKIPWQVLAGSGDPPAEPSPSSGRAAQ